MTAAFATFVPSGWASIGLSPLDEGRLRSLLSAVRSSVPTSARDAVDRYVSGPLENSVRNLAEGGALRVLMPAKSYFTSPIRPMIAIAPMAAGAAEITDPTDYIVLLAQSEPSARMIEPPGMVGIKTRTVTSTTERLREGLESVPSDLAALADGQLTEYARRATRTTVEIRYVLGVPGEPERWLDVLATYSHEDGDAAKEAAELTEEFLDSWIGTVRWTDAA